MFVRPDEVNAHAVARRRPVAMQRSGYYVTWGRSQKAVNMFENVRQDLRAYNGRWSAQGFWAMVVYRFGRWRYGTRPAVLRKFFSLVYKVLYKFVQIITGIELPCEAKVGRHLVIDHFGGIIISGFATFGDNCRIRDGVVVGLRRVGENYAPTIGNNVDIGSGAKLLGRIRVGDNVLIGANAVVLCDVPNDSIAVGVPAIVKPRSTGPTQAMRNAINNNTAVEQYK